MIDPRRLLATWKDYFAAVGTGHALIAIQALVQVVLVPVYLASIGRSSFGVLVFVGSFLTITNLCLNAMRGVLVRYMALAAGRLKFNEVRVHFAAIRILLTLYFLLAAFVLGGFSFAYAIAHTEEVSSGISFETVVFLSAVHLLVQGAFNAEYFLLLALRRQAWGNTYFILGIVFFVVPVLPWLYFGGGIEGVVALQLLSSVIITVLALAHRHRRLTDVPRRTDWYRLPAAIATYFRAEGLAFLKYAILVAALQADIVLVGLLGGPQMAADFTIIWRIAEVCVLVLWRFSDSLQPEILRLEARGEFSVIAQVYRRGLPVMAWLSLVAATTYALAGSYIVDFWVGEGTVTAPSHVYWAAGAAIFWLALARYSAVFPATLARLQGLIRIALFELLGRLALILILFGTLGYFANLLAISIVHACGIAWAYMLLARRITASGPAG